VVSDEQRPAGQAETRPALRVAVAVGRPARNGKAYQVVSPDRLLRMLTLLTEADDELRQVDLPPQSLARVQRQLSTVSAEIERSVSPALAEELQHLLGQRTAEPGPREVRIEYVALLGWVSGLVIGMLGELEAAAKELHITDCSLTEMQSR
jgi:hypothetical protein